MKINRLVEIIVILLNREKVTSRELADRFEVSARTIYRDIEVLSSAGVPIYTNRGQGGGISLLDHYTLNKMMLSSEERESLLLALKTLSATNQGVIDSTLEKLGGLFGQDIDSYIEVDFRWWGAEYSTDTRFEKIKEAIIKEQQLQFTYINTKNEKSLRSVKPYKICYKGQAWYLKAYCLERDAFRIFKITRMNKVEILSDKFSREALKKIEPKEENPVYQLVEVKLKFKQHMLYRVVDYYEEDQIRLDEQGNCIVSIKWPYDEWIYAHILSYGDGVQVVEPHWLKEEVKNRAQNILKAYHI